MTNMVTTVFRPLVAYAGRLHQKIVISFDAMPLVAYVSVLVNLRKTTGVGNHEFI